MLHVTPYPAGERRRRHGHRQSPTFHHAPTGRVENLTAVSAEGGFGAPSPFVAAALVRAGFYDYPNAALLTEELNQQLVQIARQRVRDNAVCNRIPDRSLRGSGIASSPDPPETVPQMGARVGLSGGPLVHWSQ